MDSRKTSADFYPGGKTAISAGGGITSGDGGNGSGVPTVPVTKVSELPERYRESDMRSKINEIARVISGGVAAFVAMMTFAVFGDGEVKVQGAKKDKLWNDDFVLTNVTVDLDGYAKKQDLSEATNALDAIFKENFAVMSNTLSDAAAKDIESATNILAKSLNDRLEMTTNGMFDAEMLEPYAKRSWVNAQGFVKSTNMHGYAQTDWVQNQGYIRKTDLESMVINSITFTNDAPKAVRGSVMYSHWRITDCGSDLLRWYLAEAFKNDGDPQITFEDGIWTFDGMPEQLDYYTWALERSTIKGEENATNIVVVGMYLQDGEDLVDVTFSREAKVVTKAGELYVTPTYVNEMARLKTDNVAYESTMTEATGWQNTGIADIRCDDQMVREALIGVAKDDELYITWNQKALCWELVGAPNIAGYDHCMLWDEKSETNFAIMFGGIDEEALLFKKLYTKDGKSIDVEVVRGVRYVAKAGEPYTTTSYVQQTAAKVATNAIHAIVTNEVPGDVGVGDDWRIVSGAWDEYGLEHVMWIEEAMSETGGYWSCSVTNSEYGSVGDSVTAPLTARRLVFFNGMVVERDGIRVNALGLARRSDLQHVISVFSNTVTNAVCDIVTNEIQVGWSEWEVVQNDGFYDVIGDVYFEATDSSVTPIRWKIDVWNWSEIYQELMKSTLIKEGSGDEADLNFGNNVIAYRKRITKNAFGLAMAKDVVSAETVTNIAREVSNSFWDEKNAVLWRLDFRDGEPMFLPVTNENVKAGGAL